MATKVPNVLPSALDISSGTATNSIYPNFYPSDLIEDPPPTSTYPYFLFPSRKYPPSAFGSAHIYSASVDYINLPDATGPGPGPGPGPGTIGGANNSSSFGGTSLDHDQSSSSSSSSSSNVYRSHNQGHNARTRYENHNFDPGTNSTNINNNNNNNLMMHHTKHPSSTTSHSNHNAPPIAGNGERDQYQHQHSHQHQHQQAPGSQQQQQQHHHPPHHHPAPSPEGRWDSMYVPADLHQQPDTVRSMGVDDNYHRLLDQNMALIETPLVAPPHAYYPQHYKTALYPYNVSAYHQLHQHGAGAGGHFGLSPQSHHQQQQQQQQQLHHHHHHQYYPHHHQHPYDAGTGGGEESYLAAPAAGPAPVDNILISLNGGNGDAGIELDGGSSYEHTVDKQSKQKHPLYHTHHYVRLYLRNRIEASRPVHPRMIAVNTRNSHNERTSPELLLRELSLSVVRTDRKRQLVCPFEVCQGRAKLVRPLPQPSVGSDDIEEKEAEMSFIHFQSTCHLALDSCRADQVCSLALKTVLMHCDQHRCHRNACMDSLQSFYKSTADDLSLDIAFCLCRKTPNRHDSCMIAQEKLHPVCAQRPPESLSQQQQSSPGGGGNGVTYNAPPACHAVAELCREDEDCRDRLEVFEQSCAVDSVTKKCAGKTSACRQAMLGILGTPLRTTCACQGSDMQQLYDCLGWQRLLWLNPCVVESQKDFHLKRLAELGLLTTTTTMATTTSTTTVRTTSTTARTTRWTPPPTPPPTKPKPQVYRPKPTEIQTIETNYVETPDTRPETLLHKQNELIERSDLDHGHHRHLPKPNGIGDGGNHDDDDEDDEDGGDDGGGDGVRRGQFENKIHQRPDEQVLRVVSTEVTEMETLPPTTTTTTTTEPTTTLAPIRYCVVQRSQQPDQLIAEGKSRRLYILDDAECSELCTCGGGGESLALTCHALCVPLAPCRTALAYYSHAAPAYQAFRGRCLCYSGRFICMRPPPGEYLLPGGIFLLLGYSSTDEALLRPHTNLGVQDAVRALQQYVLQHIDNSTLCTITLFNITEENIILSIRLPMDPKLTAMQLLKMEKDQCTRILETISHQINTQYVELSAHRLLSIFKMAEVQIVWPQMSHAPRYTTPTVAVSIGTGIVTVLLTLFGTLLSPFVRWWCSPHTGGWRGAPRRDSRVSGYHRSLRTST
ncbi:hypothetical protein AND_007042 [Anopheles darlingi]|uniref:GDNF/GAS1 domain-containing protein n=1 Tax=Anopheles darlingi TaxID=43151 RepID=W5JEQ3_ANODA|nr:hypothetical protein AND_007042 [Anopheles darlingi]